MNTFEIMIITLTVLVTIFTIGFMIYTAIHENIIAEEEIRIERERERERMEYYEEVNEYIEMILNKMDKALENLIEEGYEEEKAIEIILDRLVENIEEVIESN